MEVLSIPQRLRAKFSLLFISSCGQKHGPTTPHTMGIKSSYFAADFYAFLARFPRIQMLLHSSMGDMVASKQKSVIDSLFVVPAFSLAERSQPDIEQSGQISP